jgi:hypothetical protein
MAHLDEELVTGCVAAGLGCLIYPISVAVIIFVAITVLRMMGVLNG